jgi:hypothetical protein
MASPTQIGISTYPARTDQPALMRFLGFLVVAGLLNSLIASLLLFRLPDAHVPTLTSLSLRALTFVVCGALAGSAGVWFYWKSSSSPFRENPPISLVLFALSCSVCWVWVPAFVLLSREDSPLTGPIAVLAAALLAASLRQVIPSSALFHSGALVPEEPELFAATLRRPRRELYGYIASLSIYLAAYEYFNGWIIDGSTLLAVCAFICVWRVTLEPTDRLDNKRQTIRAARRVAWLVIPAFLVTLFALLYGVEHRNRVEADAALAGTNGKSGGDDVQKSQSTTEDSGSTIAGYQSIILWPVPEKKQIVPPLPAQASLLAPGTTKPLIIKFDGPYWYFQPPHKTPASNAFQAHGTPLAHDIQSNNFIPLTMEAHQTLGSAIPLARCREIQLGILNDDNRPGAINIAVLLTDSSSPAKPQVYLGQQPIASSQPDHFSVKTSPAGETLHFPVPAGAKIRKFDAITVMFFPDDVNYDQGPKVAIQEFQLVPR